MALQVSLALASEAFTVKDIRVEGLQRISAGTVFNYLPIKVGDEVEDAEELLAFVGRPKRASVQLQDAEVEDSQRGTP